MDSPNLILDSWQKEFLEHDGDKILCTGRQVGKSLICARDAGEWAVKHSKKTILMIAPTERQSYALFQRTLNYLFETYPKAVVVKGKNKPTSERFFLTNGTVVYCLPTGERGIGIRFLTIDRLYGEEASRIPEDVWTAVIPMLLTTGGSTILLSTPHGKQGEFYRVWSNKDSAYNSFRRFSIDSEKVVSERKICATWTTLQRTKALEKIEQAKARFSKKMFMQEYMGEFVEDLFRWFTDEWIASACTQKRRERIYEDPETNHFMGVDIARMGEDDIVYAIGDRRSKIIIQVESIIERKKLTTETEGKIRLLAQRYNCRMVYIDAGSGTLGVSIMDHLLRTELKKRVKDINNAKRILEYDEDRNPIFIKLQKEDLYDNLRALGEQSRIRLLDDDDIKYSLASIQYEYVVKPGQPTRLKIWGDYAHIAEALTRLAQCVKEKIFNYHISYI